MRWLETVVVRSVVSVFVAWLVGGVALVTATTGGSCPGDWDGSGRVTVNELVLAVNTALRSCDEVTVEEAEEGVVTLSIGSAVGTAAATVQFFVTLRGGTPSAVENVIAFSADSQVHDCRVNPTIDRPATIFDFDPDDCSEGSDCDSVRALVLSLGNVAPIPTGSLLYSCRVDVPAEGCRPLACLSAGSSDDAGVSLDTVCEGNEVCVVGSAAPCPGDVNRDGRVTVAELIAAVNAALDGCP